MARRPAADGGRAGRFGRHDRPVHGSLSPVAADVHGRELYRHFGLKTLAFFGVSEQRYQTGLFPDTLPAVLDLPLSWLALVVAKMLYFCGLKLSSKARPSSP